jgi:hypothetical protein
MADDENKLSTVGFDDDISMGIQTPDDTSVQAHYQKL